MNYPEVPKTDPFCDKCINNFNQTARKIVEINRILNEINSDIETRKIFCESCCKNTKQSTTCRGIRTVNTKSAETVTKIKRNLVELYHEIKKYYLPNVPSTLPK